MAFYKVENEFLLKADNDLFGPGWQLLTVDKDLYTYPVEGWYWFDTDEEAVAALGVDFTPAPEEPSVGFPPPPPPPMIKGN